MEIIIEFRSQPKLLQIINFNYNAFKFVHILKNLLI